MGQKKKSKWSLIGRIESWMMSFGEPSNNKIGFNNFWDSNYFLRNLNEVKNVVEKYICDCSTVGDTF